MWHKSEALIEDKQLSAFLEVSLWLTASLNKTEALPPYPWSVVEQSQCLIGSQREAVRH